MAGDKMTRRDYPFTLRFLEVYAKKIVERIKNRTPVDTGALQDSINYKITYYNDDFNIHFAVGDGKLNKGSGQPSEYGTYLDAGGNKIKYHYRGTSTRTKGWFSKEISGLGEKYFVYNLDIVMAKDRQIWIDKYMKELQKEANKNAKKK